MNKGDIMVTRQRRPKPVGQTQTGCGLDNAPLSMLPHSLQVTPCIPALIAKPREQLKAPGTSQRSQHPAELNHLFINKGIRYLFAKNR